MSLKSTAHFVAYFLLAFTAVGHSSPLQKPKKNVLFIAFDDLRPVMGSYGGAALTPNIDAFAKSSTVFQRHYVQWPSCSTSRASLLSGLRPKTHGGFTVETATEMVCSHPTTAPTLPFYLKSSGYNTLSFGKIYHSIFNYPGAGWSKKPWEAPMHWSFFVNAAPALGRRDYQPAYEIYTGPDNLHGDYQMASQVIEALQQTGNQPFCIFGGFHKPHLPYVAPQKYWDLYKDADIELLQPAGAPSGCIRDCYRYTEFWNYGVKSPTGEELLFSKKRPPTPQEARDLTHAYYASVSFVDAQVGRILRQLEALGLEQNTAVVLWSDHGYHLGDQQRWSKGLQFEGDMRSPLMVRLPGSTNKTGNTQALVETIDLYPTLAEYCGLPVPRHTEGVSLLPVISGQTNQVKKSALSEFIPVNVGPVSPQTPSYRIYSLRSKDYRYIQWKDANKKMRLIREELYDLRNSLYEQKNLVNVANQQGTLRKLRQLMKREHPDY